MCNRQILTPLLAGLLSLLALIGCKTTDSWETPVVEASSDRLRVGVTPNSRPMIYKQGDEYLGMDAEIARSLGKELGREVVFVEMPFEEQLSALAKDKIDIVISNMTITQARQTRVAFSLPYLRSGQMALIRRKDVRGDFRSPSDVVVTDRTIGTEKSTTGEFFAESYCINANLRSFTDPADGAKALAAGKIDVFIHDAPVIWSLAGDFEADGLVPINSLLTQEYIAAAMAISDTALQAEVNKVIAKWTQDGTLVQMSRRWVPFL